MLSYASEMSSLRDKPLSKEEQEEEEMRNELAGEAFYCFHKL